MSLSDDRGFRGWRFETFEERLALSVQPVADFWYDTSAESIVEPSSALVQPLTQPLGQPQGGIEGHGWTDLLAARDQYGLRGSGQTVAIIDSGVAYDHVALGGGLGSAYKVVGGWDFAENDANPYDDGPAGFHGTHVAGIVGAQDKRYPGVAPSVDLVALRVFDDQGNGSFTWIDQALQWVHKHKSDYEFPITTVNLSLGTDWNASTLPKWASLESDLKQLADDGIFISVAAGNSFLTYNAAGLSYPAVSPNVTPVASVDASGNLSRYSQRNDRVLAAPGEKIMSTLPDAFYGGDGIKNDWGAASGTSMAAPYVAGASVLVREAMQDLGYTNITEASIDDLFHRTADKVYDPATSASYDRINIARALGTLVGLDDYSSTPSAATSVGQLSTTLHIVGTIGSITDQDYFQFAATRSGTATFTLTSPQNLGAAWQSGSGRQISSNLLTLPVVAGQTYVVGVGGDGSTIGKYDVDVRLLSGSSGPPPDQFVTISGNSATVTGTAGNDSIHWQSGGQLTINGIVYSLTGVSQITIDGGGGNDSLVLVGGPAAETIVLRPGGAELTAFGSSRLSAAGIESIQFLGSSTDRAWFYDSAVTDAFEAAQQWARLSGSGFTNFVSGVGAVTAISQNGGADIARLYDSAGNDSLTAGPAAVALQGNGFTSEARGFSQVIVLAAAGGYDTATIHDTAGADQLDASATYVWLRGAGYSIRAQGFDNVVVTATYGSGDFAHFIGSQGDDVLAVWKGSRNFYTGGVEIHTDSFDRVQFDGGGGYDMLDYYASGKTTYFYGRSDYGSLLDQAFQADFFSVESVLAHVRRSQRLKTDLAALDFAFKKWDR